ncbi:MAG: LysR family transcriptional regulator [Pseudomonadota bacterium]
MVNIDLKHLRILKSIHQTQSLTRTAASLGMSQPSISVGLAHLRRYFGDPLFVRTTAGMKPTPHAEHLMKSLGEAMDRLDLALGLEVRFDPARSDRLFQICMADVGTLVVLPKLLAHIKVHAPNVQLEVILFSDRTPLMLETGEADLAIGVSPQLEAGFYQQRLYQENLVCVARADHPRIRDKITQEDYLAERHVIVSPPGSSHWVLEKALAERGMERKVGLRLPSFLALGSVIATTDFIATVPRRLGEHFAAGNAVRTFAAPARLPSYIVRQHWHERYHRNPHNIWLRGIAAEVLSR